MPENDRPMSRLRTLVAYVGLVGVPAIGVAGVVHRGPLETPPSHVAGDWTLAEDDTCMGEQALRLEQSGRFLRVVDGGEDEIGAVALDRVRFVVRTDGGPCAGRHATFDGRAEADGLLRGVIEVVGCSSCTSPISVVGRRSDRSP